MMIYCRTFILLFVCVTVGRASQETVSIRPLEDEDIQPRIGIDWKCTSCKFGVDTIRGYYETGASSATLFKLLGIFCTALGIEQKVGQGDLMSVRSTNS